MVARFHISLDHPDDHVYMPGDKVLGKVVFDTPKGHNIHEVTIEFQGKCYSSFKENPLTMYSKARTYEINTLSETFYLFKLRETLLAGPYTLESKLWEWPFDFEFPHKTHSYQDVNLAPCSTIPLPLPPSMQAQGLGDLARVTYKVKAHVHAALLGHSDEKELCLINGCAEAQPDPTPEEHSQTFTDISLHLHQDHSNKSSLGQRIKDHIGSNHRGPLLEFTASCILPTVLVAGNTIHLPFKVETDLGKSTGQSSPSFSMSGIKILLLRRTHTLIKNEVEEIIESFDVALNQALTYPLNLGSHVDLSTILPCIVPDVSPSFTSYAIESSFILRVAVTLQCADKKFITMPEVKKVTVQGKRLETAGEAEGNLVPSHQALDVPPMYSPENLSSTPRERKTHSIAQETCV